MSKQTETMILGALCFQEEVSNKFLPHIDETHFAEGSSKHLFKIINNFVQKYDACPNLESLILEIDKYEISEDLLDECKTQIGEFRHSKKLDPEYIKDETAAYIQNRAIYNAMMKSLDIAESGDADKLSSIPDILTDAIAMDFSSDIGLDFYDDAESRFAYYHSPKRKIPFHIETLNRATKGGTEPKTLNIIIGGTGAGKTAMLVDYAANYMINGYDVLYITLEMAAEKIYQRIDANVMDMTMDGIMTLKKDEFLTKVQGLQEKSTGRIKVKEWPPTAVNSRHISAFLKDMKMKQGFKPTVILVDYLNLMQSSLYSSGSNNSYTIVKAISEELRGIAVQNDCVMWSATQMNRDGLGNTDPDLTNTSDSVGTAFTADFVMAALSTEQLKSEGKMFIKQLKSRYDDITKMPAFTLGCDFAKMKMYDVGQSQNIKAEINNTPVDDDDLYAKFKGGSKKRDTSSLKV